MSDEEINKRIHEVMGLCFHVRSTNQCIRCHKILIKAVGAGEFECLPANLNFLTWEGFGLMWEFMQKHPGWYNFWHHYWHTKLINPRALAEAVVEFFEEDKP